MWQAPQDAPDYIQGCHMAFNIDEAGNPFVLTAWQPSYEDLQALNAGKPVYVKVIGGGMNPMTLFTEDGI